VQGTFPYGARRVKAARRTPNRRMLEEPMEMARAKRRKRENTSKDVEGI
jgi:hypothetical protein